MVNINKWAAGKPLTRKLYMVDSYLREYLCEILDYIVEKGRRYYVVLNQTIFHPKSGGQPSDTGWIIGDGFRFEVRKVLDVSGVIVHYGKLVEGEMSGQGSTVKCVINWERRYKVMRLHTAGHILDYAIRNVYGRIVDTLNVFHGPPEPYVVYDVHSPSSDELEKIVKIANRIVSENRPVRIMFVSEKELTKAILNAPNIQRLPKSDKYRIVMIEGANAIPCTGTHVKRTGEIGRIVVKKVEELGRGFKLVYDVE